MTRSPFSPFGGDVPAGIAAPTQRQMSTGPAGIGDVKYPSAPPSPEPVRVPEDVMTRYRELVEQYAYQSSFVIDGALQAVLSAAGRTIEQFYGDCASFRDEFHKNYGRLKQ